MKTPTKIAFALIVAASTSIYAQNNSNKGYENNSQTKNDSLGLAGDNLDLSAVLNIFKQAKDLETFEKNLNAADEKVNNLDLNHDGQVDYIRVVESSNDSIHTLVLQVPVSKSESQDVAVIQVEKVDKSTAHVQIVGDEALYGKNYVIEPKDDSRTEQQQSGKPQNGSNTSTNNKNALNYSKNITNPSNNDVVINANTNTDNSIYYNNYPQSFVNAWGWGSVSVMFGPSYSYWNSPYYWGYYPTGWYCWSPFGCYAYHQRIMSYGYYNNYGRGNYNHMRLAYNGYYGGRVYSPYVQKTIKSSGSVYGHNTFVINNSFHNNTQVTNHMLNNGGWNNHHNDNFGGGWHGGAHGGGIRMGAGGHGGGGHMGGGVRGGRH